MVVPTELHTDRLLLRNIASVRVLEKPGMTREGLLRKHLIRRGERVDRVYYGLLREEWEAIIWTADREDLTHSRPAH